MFKHLLGKVLNWNKRSHQHQDNLGKSQNPTFNENITIKISVLLNLIYRLNAIPIKTLSSYFTGIDKLILKLMWRVKRSTIINTIWKENKVGGLMDPTSRPAIKLQ